MGNGTVRNFLLLIKEERDSNPNQPLIFERKDLLKNFIISSENQKINTFFYSLSELLSSIISDCYEGILQSLYPYTIESYI